MSRDRFSAIPCKPSLSERLPATQELLLEVSHKTKALVSKPDELNNCNSVTWRCPLTSVTDDIVVVLLDGCWQLVALLWAVLPEGWIALGFVDCFGRRKLSVAFNVLLCELLLPSARHFLCWGHWRNVCLSRKHEKKSLLSATNLALWVGVFSLKTQNSHCPWSPLPNNAWISVCWRRKTAFVSLSPFVMNLMQIALRLFWSLLL